mmetsp:Transcript_60167/g.141646  ORF Transcript_60167/g.141646 Transcript_60167/m.141646 type:complete len:136 (+) Transcript_60167:98-505(+)
MTRRQRARGGEREPRLPLAQSPPAETRAWPLFALSFLLEALSSEMFSHVAALKRDQQRAIKLLSAAVGLSTSTCSPSAFACAIFSFSVCLFNSFSADDAIVRDAVFRITLGTANPGSTRSLYVTCVLPFGSALNS